MLRHIYADKAIADDFVRHSGLDSTIVCPTKLTDGPRTGTYKAGFGVEDKTIRAQISRADVADFMLKQLSDSTYRRKTPGISY